MIGQSLPPIFLLIKKHFGVFLFGGTGTQPAAVYCLMLLACVFFAIALLVVLASIWDAVLTAAESGMSEDDELTSLIGAEKREAR